MTLDLASLPVDLSEATPDPDHASEPANEPACELAPETATSLPAEPASPSPHAPATTSPLAQQDTPQTFAGYPSDHFVHALYGGFLGDLPGTLRRADLWDRFIDAYTDPELSHHFAHTVFPGA